MVGENAELFDKIGKSLSEKGIKPEEKQSLGETKKALEEAQRILDEVYKSNRQDLINSFRKEYQDLRKSIITSLNDDRKITQSELSNIKKELNDINLKKQNQFKLDLHKYLSNAFSGVKLNGKIATELMNELILEKNIWKFNKIIYSYSKHYKIDIKKLDFTKITNLVLNIQERKEKLRNGNNDSRLKQIEELKKINKNITEQQRKSIGKKMKEGKSINTIIKEDKKLNKNINNTNNEKTKENKDKKDKKEKDGKTKKYEHKKGTTKPDILKTKDGNVYIGRKEDNGEYKIKTGRRSKTKKEINVTEEEYKTIKANPENAENFIKFRDFFDELNLKSVWKYRKELITAMKNSGLNIDYGDNGLTSGEFINFGNTLIKFINKTNGGKIQYIDNNKDIRSIRNELLKYSGVDSILEKTKTFGFYGEDRFAYDLRNNGIIGTNLNSFDTFNFSNVLKL